MPRPVHNGPCGHYADAQEQNTAREHDLSGIVTKSPFFNALNYINWQGPGSVIKDVTGRDKSVENIINRPVALKENVEYI